MDSHEITEHIKEATSPLVNNLLGQMDKEEAIDLLINRMFPPLLKSWPLEYRLRFLAMLSSIMSLQTGELLDGTL